MDLLKLESCRREREGTKELVSCREAQGSEARARLQRKNSSSTTGGKRTLASAAFPSGAKSPIPHPGRDAGRRLLFPNSPERPCPDHWGDVQMDVHRCLTCAKLCTTASLCYKRASEIANPV